MSPSSKPTKQAAGTLKFRRLVLHLGTFKHASFGRALVAALRRSRLRGRPLRLHVLANLLELVHQDLVVDLDVRIGAKVNEFVVHPVRFLDVANLRLNVLLARRPTAHPSRRCACSR